MCLNIVVLSNCSRNFTVALLVSSLMNARTLGMCAWGQLGPTGNIWSATTNKLSSKIRLSWVWQHTHLGGRGESGV